MNRAEATFKFFKSLKNLVDQGLIKSIDQAKAFAKQEFGEVSDLMTLQINKIFKNKNQPVVGKKDPVFDNTVETIPFDDAGAPFNPKDPQKVYGKPKEVDTGSPFEDYRRNVLGEGKNKPLDPDDVLPNYNETPGEFARRQTPGSKENILEQMKAAYPQRYNNLTGNETAAELKGIMEKANKTDVPFSTTPESEKIPKVGDILENTNLDDLFDEAGNLNKDAVLKAAIKKPKNRPMTADELEDFEMEISPDNLEAYDFDGTVEDGARILREEKKYTDDMFLEYKKGKLDPVAGDKSPARKRFLEKKLEEMEMSGDTRLMSQDEIEELATFDLGTDMDKAVKKFKDETLENSIKLNNFDPKGRKPSAKGGRIKMAKGGLPNILGF